MPPILFARPTHEWINRVDQRLTQLSEMKVSTEQKSQLDRWAEIEFVLSTLKLDGVDASHEQVDRFATSGATGTPGDESMIVSLLESLRKVETLARKQGRAAALTPDLLLDLGNSPGDARGFRKGLGQSAEPAPVRPEHLIAAIDSACRWYSAESFAELHPVEQAAIVLLRLIELQPFERANERAALVGASLFTLRSELPPIIVRAEAKPAYRAALSEGFRMNTKPMVELVAEVIEYSTGRMIERISR